MGEKTKLNGQADRIVVQTAFNIEVRGEISLLEGITAPYVKNLMVETPHGELVVYPLLAETAERVGKALLQRDEVRDGPGH